MRRIARILAVILVAGITGCVTPSIPIPPPDPAAMTFTVARDQNNEITNASLEYPPTESYKGGIAYVFNRSIGRGVIEYVKADGSIGPTAPVEANAGHALIVTVENDDQTVSTCITLTRDAAASDSCQ